MLHQLEPPTGVAATFADDSLEVGTVTLADRRDAGLALRVALTQNTRLSRELSLQLL